MLLKTIEKSTSFLHLALLIDPDLRLLGLQYLRKDNTPEALPKILGLLDDPDLRVVTTADATLRKWTGQDFGVRVAQSIPKAGEGEIKGIDSANSETIQRGVQRWKEWWSLHGQKYPPASMYSSPSPPIRLRTADFTLKNLKGQPTRLSDFRGKVVLLNFWASWCSACRAEIPDLIELQRKNASRLVILGISLDGITDEHGHSHGANGDELGDENDHSPAEQKGLKGELLKIHAQVERIVKQTGINYPILLDPTSRIGRRFNGGELPTNVLIDPEGYVRRRFIGRRSVGVLERMIDEVDRSAPSALERRR